MHGLAGKTVSVSSILRKMKNLFSALTCLVLVVLPAALDAANEPVPTIVSREAWGARAPRPDISTWERYGLERPDYTRVVLHVTSMGHGQGAAEMKRIQNFHMDDRGFSDIGYNYLIDSAGTIYEGRSLDYVPSHAGRSVEGDTQHDITLDPDYRSIGIVFSADTDEALTRAQVEAAVRLVDYLKSRHPIETIVTHTEVKAWLIARGLTPHHDFDPERCPGSGSIEQMVEIRRRVDPRFDPSAYRKLFAESAE